MRLIITDRIEHKHVVSCVPFCYSVPCQVGSVRTETPLTGVSLPRPVIPAVVKRTVVEMKGIFLYEPRRVKNLSSGCPTRADTNRTVQPQMIMASDLGRRGIVLFIWRKQRR